MRKVLILLCLAAATGLLWHYTKPASSAAEAPVMVFCAAGLKKPVEEIAAAYEKETGTPVRLQFGGTSTLLSQLRVAKQGDLFIAADDGSLADAKKLDLTREELRLVRQHPVIAVAKGNPKQITGIESLLADGVKVALANPEAASVSKITKKLLGPKWDALAAKAAVMKPTVMDVAADLSLGSVDAAIVWDSTVPQFEKLEAVAVPELAAQQEHATAAVLASSADTPAALRFARYLSAPEKGAAIFAKHHFAAVKGDAWSPRPDLILYSGGVNRLAIEGLLKKFAAREGISVTTTFNGCGILCAAMKTMGDTTDPKYPDVYYACDICFVPPVAKEFPEAVLLTEAEIVIAVPKGNPKGIHTLADLAREGLKVGICNAEQSTLGYLTQAMLKSMNLYDAVSKNASAQSPTGDLLVNQLRTGSLDAAVVYLNNIQPQIEHLEPVKLPADKAKAIQPFAVRQDSPHRQLGQRLLAFLLKNRESFEQAGFTWSPNLTPIKSSEIELPEWLKQK
ncbi:MAG: molybdate ABC transporter substrate-binding protein [Verrucomicrobiaceae bacterium]|nr:molybdate ABC transporter substrate-binding protein [Verrucomicrobiaceae bacterium]